MTPLRWTLALLLLASTVALSAPAASAIDCRDSGNPFPPSPVGGEVGRAYTTTTGVAYTLISFAGHTGCATAAQGIETVNDQCVFLIGEPCIIVY